MTPLFVPPRCSPCDGGCKREDVEYAKKGKPLMKVFVYVFVVVGGGLMQKTKLEKGVGT
jgi:hypothetical protein